MNTYAGDPALVGGTSHQRLFHAGMAWLLVVVAIVEFAPGCCSTPRIARMSCLPYKQFLRGW